MIINHVDTAEVWLKLQEQCFLVGFSVTLALFIGLPIGITLTRMPKLRRLVLVTTSALWTIPSLALFALLIPLFGIGTRPAIIVLSLYALLPIIRNTISGMLTVPEGAINAANGLGFTTWQRIRLVELPLAMPVIITGVRTAVTITVGIATLAAFIGAGGLGDFINRGIATNDPNLLLLGAIPAALMALLLDSLIAWVEKNIMHHKSRKQTRASQLGLAGVAVMLLAFSISPLCFWQNPKNTIHIASKNLTESSLLSELMAQLIEAKTTLNVKRHYRLGTTDIVQQALRQGAIDLYPEYTGTAYILILKNRYKDLPAKKLFEVVNSQYQTQFGLRWLAPFGFDNSQALAVPRQLAERHHLKTSSDIAAIASGMTVGASPEAVVRADSLPGLKRVYHLNFQAFKGMASALLYKAIAHHAVDSMIAFTTDPRIEQYDLTILEDDQHAFPPYDAAPVIRQVTLEKHPEVAKAIQPLLGKIDNQTMRALNYEVDISHRPLQIVAHEFLVRQHLLLK